MNSRYFCNQLSFFNNNFGYDKIRVLSSIAHLYFIKCSYLFINIFKVMIINIYKTVLNTVKIYRSAYMAYALVFVMYYFLNVFIYIDVIQFSKYSQIVSTWNAIYVFCRSKCRFYMYLLQLMSFFQIKVISFRYVFTAMNDNDIWIWYLSVIKNIKSLVKNKIVSAHSYVLLIVSV